MNKDNNTPQEQRAQEQTHPVSLDPEDLEGSEMENISGGMGSTKTQPTTTDGSGCSTVVVGQ